MTFGILMGDFFAEASATIAAIRVSLSLPPLLPSGAIVVGQEWLSFEHDAPRIVAVPTRTEYRGANAGDFAGINEIDLLLGLCRETGTTLVLVTHNADHAAKCGRQLVLREGRFA